MQYGYCQCGCGQKTKISEVSNRSKDWIRGEPLKYILGHLLKGNHYHLSHGYAGRGKKINRTYRIWANMKTRCFNPRATQFEYWGGRGITVCERWLLFENFLADMGECPLGLSLDRINNDGNYEAENCRWTTMSQQARNRRRRAFAHA